ncbi:hypothetical protein CJF30_00009972 [Rutstroemia sp. NJR-2017a BBW]|nr:hypothetical protein CJF30_00009972 [Rutstroemia sp. NJR-2017a BBW]
MKLLYIYLKLYGYRAYSLNKDIPKLDKLLKYKLDNINITLLIGEEEINTIITKIELSRRLSLLENKEEINLITLYYKLRKSPATLILPILSKYYYLIQILEDLNLSYSYHSSTRILQALSNPRFLYYEASASDSKSQISYNHHYYLHSNYKNIKGKRYLASLKGIKRK